MRVHLCEEYMSNNHQKRRLAGLRRYGWEEHGIDLKPYKVHQISLLGKMSSLSEARFSTLEAAKRYVRPRRLVAIYKDRKKIWPKS